MVDFQKSGADVVVIPDTKHSVIDQSKGVRAYRCTFQGALPRYVQYFHKFHENGTKIGGNRRARSSEHGRLYQWKDSRECKQAHGVLGIQAREGPLCSGAKFWISNQLGPALFASRARHHCSIRAAFMESLLGWFGVLTTTTRGRVQTERRRQVYGSGQAKAVKEAAHAEGPAWRWEPWVVLAILDWMQMLPKHAEAMFLFVNSPNNMFAEDRRVASGKRY